MRWLVPLLVGIAPAPLHALQGDMDPRATADRYESALRRDSRNAEAHWRAAVALVDLGKLTPDKVKSAARDSLYQLAEHYARRAVELAPETAEAHFALALALGRSALTRGRKERVRSAREIRDQAQRAIEIDPAHDGAWHVLGRWHVEVERLSNLEEFFARTFLGGAILREASYTEAARCLERAVELRGDFIYHRLDLAEVYLAQERWDEARAQLRIIQDLPAKDILDHVHRARAGVLLERIRNQR